EPRPVRDQMAAASAPARRSLLPAALVAIGVAGIIALAIALVGSLVASVVTGLLVLAVGLRLAWVVTRPAEVDEGRRRLLLGLGMAGVAAVAGGSTIGRVTQHATRSDPTPDLDHMAKSIGSDALVRVKRGYFPG